MADAMVSLAIQKISDILTNGSEFLHGIDIDVLQLQLGLKQILFFLKDAEFKQEKDEQIRNWVSEIRSIVYEVEDVLDNFLTHFTNTNIGIASFITKLSSKINKTTQLQEIDSKIKSLHLRIANITYNLQAHGIKSICEEGESSSTHSRRSSKYLEEDEFSVKMEISTWDLVYKLLNEEDQVGFVSIFGVEGLGKTALAKKVYNCAAVKRHFDCYAWAVVSQTSSLKDILYEILSQLGSSANLGKEQELILNTHNVLKNKRYLIVIDDIYETEMLNRLKRSLPNGRFGSKILFTTSKKDATKPTNNLKISAIEIPFLTRDESWKLFCSKIFAANIFEKSSFLLVFEKIGKEMVRLCQGLPLAIVLLGGLLATKKSMSEWKAVRRNMEAEIQNSEQKQQALQTILSLCYHGLPIRLKPCFLYLAQFPEKKPIHTRTLIRSWIAEGFVSKPLSGDENETIEDVAEQYLEELVSRNMVQVSKLNYTKTGIKSFQMHNLVREMCLSKAKEGNFLSVVKCHVTDDCDNQNLHLETRRVAAHLSAERQIDIAVSYVPVLKGLSSLVYFIKNNDQIMMTTEQKEHLFKNFRLLRVLNLQNLIVIYLPNEISNLVHLRYLGLRETKLRGILPYSIAELKNLDTLDLRQNYWLSCPNVVWKMETLRNLLADRTVTCSFRLDTLLELQTLKWIKAKNLIRRNAMFKLRKIINLGIEFEKMEEVEKILNSPVFQSGRLRTLKMLMSHRSSFTNFKHLSDCQNLTKVKLYGHISEPEDSNSVHILESLPRSIAKLELRGSKLKRDPMIILEKLPNLMFLSLDEDSYKGSKMVCSANGFPQLETLHICKLTEAEEWIVEGNAMKCLKSLSITSTQNLKMLPQGLKSITTLQQLEIFEMPEEFKNRIQVINGVEGEDFNKVRHIPSILYN